MGMNSEAAKELPALGCASCRVAGVQPRCGNGLEKTYPTTAVRYGFMKYIGEFAHPPGMVFTCGANVVVRTQRGVEIGEQVSLTCNGCSKSVAREQMQTYIENSGAAAYAFEAGRILREATPDDLWEDARIRSGTAEKHRTCQELAEKHGLPMKVVECEHLFGGERIIFYFMAEGRVDFRALVKDLAKTYRTRIEMRQIGARDEARLLADYETCGRECCCKVFLKELKPVSMKMAKTQKSTLDPSKVSGRCGRLKCCLRYEHTSYQDLERCLPRLGATVRTRHGDGVVINRQILTQLIQLRTPAGGTMAVCVEDILPPEAPATQSREEPEAGARLREEPRPPEPKEAPKADRGEPAESSPAARAADSAAGDEKGESPTKRRRRRGRRRRRNRRSGGGGQGSEGA